MRIVPSTVCDRARQAVSQQLDGELSELGSARLSAHLRECEDCTAYALEVAAIATRLRAAPLEQLGSRAAVPARPTRHGLQLAAMTAAAAAVGLSLTLAGQMRSRHTPTLSGVAVPAEADIPSLHADSEAQHLLAMAGRFDLTPRIGRVVAI